MFKLLRFYSIASFVLIFISAALLGLFYRQVSIQWNTRIAEENNIALAQTVLNAIRPALIKYLNAENQTNAMPPPFPSELATSLHNVASDTPALHFRIYNRNGVIVYSSDNVETGTDKSGDAGFMAALSGKTISSLIYRDRLNAFKSSSKTDNLLQSYVPVRSDSGKPVQGVFGIDVDVTRMVKENEHTLFILLLGAELILAILFGMLILVVRRANQHMETQQRGIRERMATLEILSDRLLNSDEQGKKKIAFDLHEGLAQTLSAIKLNVESNRMMMGEDNEKDRTLESIVPAIQSAIQEIRSIAIGLRPPSLDELGLIPTIGWYCNKFEQLHPEIRVKSELKCTEDQIPAPLKIVIYRIIESAFSNVAQHTRSGWIQLALQSSGDEISVEISSTEETSAIQRGQRQNLQLRFAEMRERTMLSGGMFSVTQDLIGKITLVSTWPELAAHNKPDKNEAARGGLSLKPDLFLSRMRSAWLHCANRAFSSDSSGASRPS